MHSAQRIEENGTGKNLDFFSIFFQSGSQRIAQMLAKDQRHARMLSLYLSVILQGLEDKRYRLLTQADQAMASLMICNGRSRFDSNVRIMPHKSLNFRSFVPKLQ